MPAFLSGVFTLKSPQRLSGGVQSYKVITRSPVHAKQYMRILVKVQRSSENCPLVSTGTRTKLVGRFEKARNGQTNYDATLNISNDHGINFNPSGGSDGETDIGSFSLTGLFHKAISARNNGPAYLLLEVAKTAGSFLIMYVYPSFVLHAVVYKSMQL